MIRLLRSIAILVLSFGLSLCTLFAQSPGKNVFTLQETLDIASSNNLDIRAAETRLNSAGSAITAAFGNFLPSIDFNLNYQRSSKATPKFIPGQLVPSYSYNNYVMGATASLIIFNGFAREANYNQAKSNFSATDENAKYVRKRVLANVRGQYLTILRNAQIVNTRREDVELAQKELERISAQYDVGRMPVSNVYAQQAELGNKELAQTQAENDFDISKSTLLTLMGLSPAENVNFLNTNIPDSLTDTDIKAFRDKLGSMQTALAAAFEKRLDYKAAQSRTEAAESNVTVSRSGYFPTLNASGGWNWSNTEFNEFSDRGQSYIGLNLSVPIFENFRTNNQIQTANVELEERTIEKHQLEQQIASDVAQAILTLNAAEKQLEITARALKSAEENFNSARERFNLGAANIVDYTTANTQFITAKINRINTVYNYLAARYQVEYATGVLD